MEYTIEQIKENRQKWLDALRSGNYKQGMSYLHYIDNKSNEHRYCCLGVACDVAKIQDWKEMYRTPDSSVYSYDSSYGVLSFDMKEWIGSHKYDPAICYDPNLGNWRAATYLNDGEGFTFSRIADALEFTWNNKLVPEFWRYE